MKQILESAAPGRPRPAPPAITHPEVLLVEETDTGLVEMLSFALAARGVRFTVTGHAATALELLCAGPTEPNGAARVAVLNVDLPGIGGVGFLEKLGALPWAWRVVVVTRTGSERDHVRALETGAVDYIVKPISIPILVARIGRLLTDGYG